MFGIGIFFKEWKICWKMSADEAVTPPACSSVPPGAHSSGTAEGASGIAPFIFHHPHFMGEEGSSPGETCAFPPQATPPPVT